GRRGGLGGGTARGGGVWRGGFGVGPLGVAGCGPMAIDRARPDAVGSRSFLCFGRLRSGVTLEAARAEITVIAAQVGRETASEKDVSVVVTGLREYLVRDSRLVLFVLSGVVALVLLIACANLAGLLLTRGVGGQPGWARRAWLGASRRRLVQQLLVESVALSATGGALGLLFGFWTSRALASIARDAVAFGQLADARLDWRVLAFTIALS